MAFMVFDVFQVDYSEATALVTDNIPACKVAVDEAQVV
jgi:hypothetical protein